MDKRQRVGGVLKCLEEKFGKPNCALSYGSPFELLVAVMLSAQCTDVRVNIVTKAMFPHINTPEQFAEMEVEEIENWIRSTGFYHNKAKNIKKCSQQLLELYEGKVPQEMDQLVDLAGVGRKTANVVRGEVWGLADGITVDTHVRRLSNLIGFVHEEENPVKIERELMKIVPKKSWIDFSHYLILHGRDTCIARRPRCVNCEISTFCKNKKS